MVVLLAISLQLLLMSNTTSFQNQVNFSMFYLSSLQYPFVNCLEIIKQIYEGYFSNNNCKLLHLSSFLSTDLNNTISLFQEYQVHLFLVISFISFLNLLISYLFISVNFVLSSALNFFHSLLMILVKIQLGNFCSLYSSFFWNQKKLKALYGFLGD